MAAIDYYFVIPAIGVIIWELYGILAVQKNIKIAGKPAGSTGSLVLFAISFFLGIIFKEEVLKLPVVYISALILFGVHYFVKAGPGENAFYRGAKCIPFNEIDFYQDIRDFKGGFSMRFHCLNGKDYVILYKEEQREELIAFLKSKRLKDYDSFEFKSQP